MPILTLIKLLYLLDREALKRHGRPVTFDSYFAMKHGPVLSLTLDKINADPTEAGHSYWHRYISERQGNDVSLVADAPRDQLSQAQEDLIDEVFAKFGKMSKWQLRDWCHRHLPEWSDPQNTSVAIDVESILRAAGVHEDEARAIEDALAAEALLEEITR